MKKKKHKVFLISVAVILLAVTALTILLTGDSERILQNKLKEKETTNLYTVEYPLKIDKIKHPELATYEKEIAEEYKTTIMSFFESFKVYEYECVSNPTVTKLNFEHLKPKQNLYMIESYCRIPGETSPYGAMPNLLFFVTPTVEMFYKVTPHFTEVFNNIENLDQLKEYSLLYVDNLNADLNSTLKKSILGASIEHFKKSCDFVSAIPQITSTASKEGKDFVYEGFNVEPELNARLYYLKYNITSDGQVVKDTDKLIAFCPRIGIVY